MTIAVLAFSHKVFLADTESDFLVTYISEASRFIDGQPLKIHHHPPLYSMIIAGLKILVRDWLLTGKIVSVAGAFLTLLFNVLLFRRLSGRYAALGVLLGAAHTFNFLAFSALATSDIFFLALYSGTLLFALLYSESSKNTWAFLTGVLTGLCLITRTNALTLVLLLPLPLVSAHSPGGKIKGFLFTISGCSLVLLSWFLFAESTGSPFYPSGNYANLAMTYFSAGEDRMSGDAYAEAAARFNSLTDVLTHDPARLIGIYIRDFIFMLGRNLIILMTPLLGLFGVLGLPALWKSSKKPFLYFLTLATLAQTGLTNFKTYEYRYYLFLFPVIGAAAGCFLGFLTEKFARSTRQAAAAFALFFLPGLIFTGVRAYSDLHPPFEKELMDAAPEIRKIIPPGSRILARKANIPFYTDSEYLLMPPTRDLNELGRFIRGMKPENLFLYFGSYEWTNRPELRDLQYLDKTPSWLEPLAVSKKRGVFWRFYRVRNDEEETLEESLLLAETGEGQP